MAFWTGTPEKFQQFSKLGPQQQPLFDQLQRANMGQGVGGSFGQAADYYRGLLSNESQDLQAMIAPEERRFREQTIPGLAHQFAGMGAGNLSSSAFRNATVNAGTDLAERIGAMRANLRSQGAQGLANLGQLGLGDYNENVLRPAQPGALQSLFPAIGSIAGSFLGGAGSMAGGALGNAFGKWMTSAFQDDTNQKGTTSPYGN